MAIDSRSLSPGAMVRHVRDVAEGVAGFNLYSVVVAIAITPACSSIPMMEDRAAPSGPLSPWRACS